MFKSFLYILVRYRNSFITYWCNIEIIIYNIPYNILVRHVQSQEVNMNDEALTLETECSIVSVCLHPNKETKLPGRLKHVCE